MSIIDSKNFTGGGMDTDTAFELIAPNDYVNALNIRNTGDTESEEGYIVAIESNELIPLILPEGINKCIGSHQFELERKIYKFIFNSFGYHTITELDYDTDVETIIFTNKTDSDGEDVLLLNTDSYVTDIKLLNGVLYFVNSDNQPCNIDIQMLKDGSYGVVTKDDFLIIRKQPSTVPTVQYVSDGTRQSNTLYGKLFQFRTQFVYENNETSAWSGISDRPVPVDEPVQSTSSNVTKNNCLLVSVEAGSNRVTQVNVAFRVGDGDWFYVKQSEISNIKSLSSQELAPGGVISTPELVRSESYDPLTNIFSFTFYHNGSYSSVDVLETDLPYDYIPKECETIEIIGGRGDLNANSSVLCIAGNTEGYPRPVISKNLTPSKSIVDVFIPEDETQGLNSTLSVTSTDNRLNRNLCQYTFKGQPKTNDNIKIRIQKEDDARIFIDLTGPDGYTVPSTQNNNLLAVMNSLAKEINSVVNGEGDNVILTDMTLSGVDNNGFGYLTFETRADTFYGYRRAGFVGIPATITLAAAGTTASRSTGSLKENSSYQLALAYYDRWGRTFPIATDQSYVVNTPTYASLKSGNAPAINWEILTQEAPEGAETYQWLLTKNRTHLTSLYIDVKYEPTWSSTGNFYTFNMDALKKFNENNPTSVLSYSYSPGDKITFNYFIDGEEKVYFDGTQQPVIDIEVVGFDPAYVPDEEEPTITHYALFVKIPTQLNTTLITDKNILVEVYSPLVQQTDLEGTVFFETGVKYPVINGEHSVTSGSITRADCYYKTRQLNLATDLNQNEVFIVEDFNFSDFYASKFTPYGRPRTYYDTPENVQFPASIRYSYEYTAKSRTNQINRFYGENVVTYDQSFGFIRRIRQRDNTLIAIQEYKVGYVPINISIIEDQIAQENVAVSTRFLNKIRYAGGTNIGIGDAKESFAEFDGTMYFVDPFRSEPMRINMNGVSSIAGKMSKYFRRTINEVYKNKTKLIGYYNIYNREYILTYEDIYSVINQLTFNVNNWQSQDTNTVDYDSLTIETSPTKGTVTIDNEIGTALYSPTLNQLGNDTFTFSFTQVGEATPIEKNVCITIGAGNTNVQQFSFGDLVDQPLSTVVVSNAVAANGVNVPVPISITGGQYKIDEGSWTSTAGYIYPGQVAVVRVTTSSSALTDVSCTLTIGDKSDTFTATTMSMAERLLLVVDLLNGQSNDTYAADEDSVNLAYTGENFIPTSGSGDPETCDILASDYVDIFSTTLSWRFIANIGKYIEDNPSATEFVFQVRGKTGLSETSNVHGSYATYGGTSTMDMTGTAGSYIPTILTPEPVDGIRTFITSVYGGADGTFTTALPVIATFVYNVATKITTLTLGEIPYIDYSFDEVNSGSGSMVVYVNDEVAASATVTTPSTRLYLTSGDEVEVHVNPTVGTPALTVDDDGVTIDVNTVGSSLVSDPVTVASDTKITAIGEVSTGASTVLEYQFTDFPGSVSFMSINRNYVNIATLTEDTELTSLSINTDDVIEVSTSSSFEGDPQPTTIQLYVDGSLFDSVSGISTQSLTITAETGKTYTFIGFVGELV
jgi:hypothetical protein